MDRFPERLLADVLAGTRVIPDIGQVEGALKSALDREVAAGRLVTWKGHWHPIAGASWGLGPLKLCYGTAAARDALAELQEFAHA